MPVSGLVIVLTDATSDAVDMIRANARFVIGEGPVNGRLPVVLATETLAEDRAQVGWLESLPGVALVEIAYHDFSDTDAGRARDIAPMERDQPGIADDTEGAKR